MDTSILSEVAQRLDAVEIILPELEQRLISMQQGDLAIESKSLEVDLVTKADFFSERVLLEFIRSTFPGDGIVAEEGGQSASEANRSGAFRWILDPIDGTVNYANRLPGWAISIGLLHGETPVGGIVTAPCMRERFRAVKGSGATLNDHTIVVSRKEQLRDGLVVTGFPYDRAKRIEPLCRALGNVMRVSGGVRRLGSAALDLCYVADGRFVGYYEMALKPWDTAAGSLIASEAGARLTDFEGKSFDIFQSGGVVVSNGHVHTDLMREVRPMLEAISL